MAEETHVVRARIEQERTNTVRRIGALSTQLERIMASSAESAGDDEHDPEGATVAFEREQARGLLRGARDDLGELDCAEARLASGEYGVCQRCAHEIGNERLIALPAARTCIDCANRAR